MIIRLTDQGYRIITQPDHARLARDILALWRTDGLPDHPRRELLLQAVLEHDNGWREADSAPLANAYGHPIHFIDYPLPQRFDIWRRGIERYREDRPYIAALILEHARTLHQSRSEDAQWRDFLAEIELMRTEIRSEIDVEESELDADYRWLHLADFLSLVVCTQQTERFSLANRHGRLSRDTLELTPFPLAGATRFSIPCRYLPNRDYPSAVAMATALATARWQSVDLRIAPATTTA